MKYHGPLVAKHAHRLETFFATCRTIRLDDPMNEQMGACPRAGMETALRRRRGNSGGRLAKALRDEFSRGSGGQAAGKELVEDEAKVHIGPAKIHRSWARLRVSANQSLRGHSWRVPSSGLVKVFLSATFICPNHTLEGRRSLYWRTNHGPIIRGLAGGSSSEEILPGPSLRGSYRATTSRWPAERKVSTVHRSCGSLDRSRGNQRAATGTPGSENRAGTARG